MSKFFHGWRRKAGCVTLVMAFVFALGWARSCFVQDLIYLPQGNGPPDQVLVSFDQSLAWLSEGCEVGTLGRYFPIWKSKSKTDVTKEIEKHAWIKRKIKEISFCGFGRREEAFAYYYGVRVFVPYWSIALPLTILSAYLLLSKSRKVNHEAATAPLPDQPSN